MKPIRAFISIDLPENIRKEIEKIQKKLPAFEGKFTELENLHLTLKFLGDVDEKILIEIKRRLREIKIKKFETRVSELGSFSPNYIKIIWVKLDNCGHLQRIIDEKLSGIFEKEERFMGHVTIARVKSVKNKNYFLGELKKIKILDGLRFQVKSFELRKSELMPEGPVYETLEEYHLV
ncbi:MAG: RNA 2',3'-cyclic phosphodiesterase [Candidatus Pacearchaeota archaeon]|nr:RNA 2',3'-cyclic phosphodiesterase [Candidatus Pacearchaeota archaeon]